MQARRSGHPSGSAAQPPVGRQDQRVRLGFAPVPELRRDAVELFYEQSGDGPDVVWLAAGDNPGKNWRRFQTPAFTTPTPEGIGTPIAPYSPVVVSGDLVFISGEVPFDESNEKVSDDFEAQARQVFDNLGRCLRAAGCGYEDVLKVAVFVSDFEHFPAFNAVYGDYFRARLPARTTVQAGLYGFDLEAEAIARKPRRLPDRDARRQRASGLTAVDWLTACVGGDAIRPSGREEDHCTPAGRESPWC